MEENNKMPIFIKIIAWVVGILLFILILGGISMMLQNAPWLGVILSILIWILLMYAWLRNTK